jgi:hypothetical protein
MASWVAEDSPGAAPAAAAPAGKGWVAEEPTTWADTANDFGRAVTNAATFGMGTRAKAYIESLKNPKTVSSLVSGAPGTYEEHLEDQVKKNEIARERSPVASIAGDVYGSMAIPAVGAEAAAARLGGGIAARAAGYGATGAVQGAAQGAGNTYTGVPEDYAKNAVMGGVLGGVLGAAGGAAFGRRPATSAARVPTEEELWAAKNTGYGALGRSGARYEQSALTQRANDIERDLLAERYHWRDSPGTWRGIEEGRGGGAPGQLNTGYGAPVDPGNIDFIVKGLNKIPQTAERATDRDSARIAKRAFNDFIENPPAGAVLPGTERAARQASTLARNARGDNAGYRRVQSINELIEGARSTTGATASGLNLQNELRKGVRTFVKEKGGISPATKGGFNEDEIGRLTAFTRPGRFDSVMRYADRILGGGGGLGALGAATVGGGTATGYFKDDPTAGALAGGGAAGVGLLLRTIGNRRAHANINELRDMIARRTPLYNYRTSMAGTQPGPGSPLAAKAVRDAVTNAIIQQNKDLPRVYVNEPD